MKKKVAILGMGPAGAMAAYRAGLKGHRVDLYDGNEKLGKKLFITGKGRCNLTTSGTIDEMMEKIPRNPFFLYSSFYQFSNLDLMDFFEKESVPLKVERGNRIFPKSDKSSDINRALERALDRVGVNFYYFSKVFNIDFHEDDQSFSLEIARKDRKEIRSSYDAVILATGGMSYPSTGSTGSGYLLAKKFGHSILPTYPSLVPFVLKDPYIKSLEGLTLKNVCLHARIEESKEKFEEFGEMVFTHNGISGPIVLSLSSQLASKDLSSLSLYLDFKPNLDDETLRNRMIREREENNNKDLSNVFSGFLPKALVDIFLEKIFLDGKKKFHSFSAEERERAIQGLKHFDFHFLSLGSFHEAIITRGGVNVDEVDPSTMESKLQKGLFFAGELLDVDGKTGGYNLTIAFSTGFVAGEHI